MKIFCFFILVTLSLNVAIAQRVHGNYKLRVHVYSMDNRPLVNKAIIFKDTTLITDSLGIVELEVYWSVSSCRNFKTRRCNNLRNDKYVTIQFSSYKSFIRNKWRKYGLKRSRKIYCKKVKFPVFFPQ